ncbi:MAG: VWA domain-containing protein [Patescibacteria group bacterium]
MRAIQPIQKTSGKPFRGSKSPGVGYLWVLFGMIIAIAAGTLLSGGFLPVDPNGPGGPPTLEPYFDPADYGKQEILITPGNFDGQETNLQLKTFMVNTCGQKTAVDFLIDTSGSMQFDNKMNRTKEALRFFTDNLIGKSVIGMQTFSAEAKEVVPLRYYKDVKEDVSKAIEDLKPGGNTVTRDGFNLAKGKLAAAITSNKYPDYRYALIVITDGIPEIPPAEQQPDSCIIKVPDANLTGDRCFAKEQDPTRAPSVANDIKNMGVDVYTVNIYSDTFPSDRAMLPYLEALLKESASQPTDTHYYNSINGDNLQEIFDNVISNICDPEAQMGSF